MVKLAENPLFDQYEARCSYAKCGKGRVIFEEAHSANLQVGDILGSSHTNTHYGRCPLCHRYQMKIVKVPQPPPRPPPRGFSSIPRE